jgi:hypothetical protein
MSDIDSSFGDYAVRDDASHHQKMPEADNAQHFQDHAGVFLWGKAGDVDLFFGGTVYHVGGRKWGFDEGAFNQSFLLITPNGRKDRTMVDNEFVSNRMDPIRRFDFTETVDDECVVWRAGQRELISQAPAWALRGEHFGVDLDVRLTAVGPPVDYHGDWAGMVDRGVAGNEVLCRGEGTCTYGGTTYSLDTGWGVRERTFLGKNFDVPSLLGTGSGYLWSWTFSEDVKVFYFSQGGSGHHAGRVFLTDRIIDFGPEQTTAEVLDTWTDPLTHETKPIRMSIRMQSGQGTLELEINTWRRMVFGFHLVGGYTTHTGKTGRARGRFVPPVGTEILIDDELCYIEHGFATPISAA